MTESFRNIIESSTYVCDYICDFIKLNSGSILIGSIITPIVIFGLKKTKSSILYGFSVVFKTKRQKLESIHIEGATVINRQFLKKIQQTALKQKFTAEDFYLAKQTDDCQWYGILNNWDIARDAHKRIKDEIEKSFEDKFRQPKIIAFIHGRGGSGKSTLLRRIAVDLIQKDFCILWINDKEFYEKGMNELRDYSKTKFLIIFEDWDRIKQNHAKEIIDSICNYPNVRILIGDRTYSDFVPKEHIFNPDKNVVELKVDENKKTITEILNIVPEWEETAKVLLASENAYNSTLYFILWVIARTFQDKNGILEKKSIQKEGLSGHFQTIVESDLRIIAKHYPGLAKALYYYGSFYSENRVYLGYNAFLDIANEFDEKQIDNNLAFTSREIKPILNIYINKTQRQLKLAGDLSIVAFNHDILTDEGLFKAQIADWHKYDESILLRILPIIINKGDDNSASMYFFVTLLKINIEYFPNEDRLKYFNILIFDKKNRGSYLNSLFNGTIIISETTKVNYIITILKDFFNFDFSSSAICNCLDYIKNHTAAKEAATAILSQPNLFKLPPPIVNRAMNILKDEEETKKVAKNILSDPNLIKLPPPIVSTTMNILKDEDETQKLVKTLLSDPNLIKSHPDIVSIAMNILKDEEETKKVAKKILSDPNLIELPPRIVSKAMNILKDEEETKKVAKTILSDPNFFEFPSDNVSIAMNILKDDEETQEAATTILLRPNFFELPQNTVLAAMKIISDELQRQNAAKRILLQPNLIKLPPDYVSVAMNILKDEDETQNVAKTILSQPNFFKLPSTIVYAAMKISKDELLRQKKAAKILSQPNFFELPSDIISIAMKISKDISKAEFFLRKWEKTSWSVVNQSLFCFAGKSNYPQFINEIVNTIIMSKSKGGEFYYRYVQLLKIPFQGINIWDEECKKIIQNYSKNSNVSLIKSIIISHLYYPDEIKNICKTILEYWKIEIVKPINQNYSPPHFGDNIKIAMGHPNLKILAKKTAEEILTSESESPGTIKEDLLEIAHKIVSDEKYPEWIIKNNEDMIE